MKIIIFLLLFCFSLYADEVILKNGSRFTGDVEKQTEGIVYFRTKEGEQKEFRKSDIIALVYDESKAKVKEVEDESSVKKIPIADKPKTSEFKPAISDSTDKPAAAEKSIYEKERYEKVTVDKELTDSIMKKFEEADKRRENITAQELELLREELRLLREERDKYKKLIVEDEEYKKDLDKRYAILEIRIRRLERYLAMDETMVEYYQSPRSPWEIVKRNAIFPGWGHRYAREEYTGNAYSTVFISLIALGFLVDYQAKSLKDSVQTKFNGDLLIRGSQAASLGSFGGILLLSPYVSYQNNMSTVRNQQNLANLMFTGAAVLYVAQLIHGYFTGVEWAKSQPRDYSNESLLKSPVSLNFYIAPDVNAFRSSFHEPVGYNWNLSFARRF